MDMKTILFDLDGTLIDTNELIIATFQHTYKQVGASLTREQAIEFIGPPLTDSFASIANSKQDIQELVAMYRDYNLKHHDDYVHAFPHVSETLTRLKDMGYQLGIVSTKSRMSVQKGLESTAIDSFFDCVVTLDDVTHAKPNPEPLYRAMEQLQAEPSTTLMVGDNSHDIEAGHRAQVKTAAVAWSLKGEATLATYHPTYMLNDMTDLLTILKA